MRRSWLLFLLVLVSILLLGRSVFRPSDSHAPTAGHTPEAGAGRAVLPSTSREEHREQPMPQDTGSPMLAAPAPMQPTTAKCG